MSMFLISMTVFVLFPFKLAQGNFLRYQTHLVIVS